MSEGSGEFGDDYAKRLQMIYPAIVFERVQADDRALLQPLFVAMHGLDLMLSGGESKIVFQPIVFDPDIKEYTLAGDFAHDARLTYRAIQALWSVNPARIRSMRLEPYLGEGNPLHKLKLRLVVKVLSLASHVVPCAFELYLKSSKTLLRPGISAQTATDLPTTDDALRQEADLIEMIGRLCKAMVLDKSVSPELADATPYSFGNNFVTQRNTSGSATVRWHLPAGGGLDTTAASAVAAYAGPRVDDICFGLNLPALTPSDGSHPLGNVRLYMDIFLFSPASASLQLIDSRAQVFYTDTSVMTEPWRFEVSGPAHAKNLAPGGRMLQAPTTERGGGQALAKLLLSKESNKRERTELPLDEYNRRLVDLPSADEERAEEEEEEEEDEEEDEMLRSGDIIQVDEMDAKALVIYERPHKRARYPFDASSAEEEGEERSGSGGGMFSGIINMVTGFFAHEPARRPPPVRRRLRYQAAYEDTPFSDQHD